MDIKIIAVDMDGTFLTKENTYDKERFMQQYQIMKEKNIRFVVASGNQYYQLRSFFPEIHEELAFVAENGAYIVDQNEDCFVAELAPKDLQTVLKAVNKYPGVNKIVCGKQSAYIDEKVDEDYYQRLNFYYHRLKKVSHFNSFDDQIFKIYISCNEDNFDKILNELKEEIGHIMTPVDCGHFGIDLIIPGMNKAHGIEFLLDKWGIDQKEKGVMAFGDSGNDFEMLEFADYGFAVGNAKESIKEIADYVIDSNESGAVLEVIDWMLKKEKMFK